MSKAIIKTEKGDMTVEFYENDAPIAVANFKRRGLELGGVGDELARDGIVRRLDQLGHRRRDGHRIARGDPFQLGQPRRRDQPGLGEGGGAAEGGRLVHAATCGASGAEGQAGRAGAHGPDLRRRV